MNEHNNGYMMLGRYAVWTSDVNANDKPDLNEAFFVKRERPPDDPLVRAGRRFAGPNQWPASLPGFRDAVLAYTDEVDALGRTITSYNKPYSIAQGSSTLTFTHDVDHQRCKQVAPEGTL